MKILLLLALSIPLYSANVYVAQASAGANNGTSCANARAVSTLAAGDWAAGNTIHLCGTITSGISAAGSGSSGNPITVLFEAGANMTSALWADAIDISSRSFIVIDGGTPCGSIQGGRLSPNACNGTIQNTANGTGLAHHTASSFIVAPSCNNCEVRNMALINNYIHTQCETTGCDTAAGTTENSVLNFSGSNFSFHDNVVHDASWAVNFQALGGETNLELYNNNMYNVAHAFAIFGGTTWPGPVRIYNNRIHDYQNWDTGGTDAYHADGLHAFGMNLASIYIYDNYFTTANQCCITAHIFLEGGTTWTNAGNGSYFVFNNVFLEPSGTVNGLAQPYHGTNSAFYNNTLSGPGANGGDLGVSMTTTNAKFNNNAITTFGTLFTFSSTDMTNTFANVATDLDYNAYGNCAGFNCFFTLGVDSGSFTTWKAGCGGCDTHSAYASSLNLNADGSPAATSTLLIAKGKNLTSLCSGNLSPLCRDINGNLRPSSGSWDIGAYNFASAPSPPTGLTVIVQ